MRNKISFEKKKSLILMAIAGFFAVVSLALLSAVCLALAPKPIVSQKISADATLKAIRTYPTKSNDGRRDFYQGKLYKSGKINVLVLEGSYEDMGRQYGALLKDELNANYGGIIEGLKKISDVTSKDIQDEGNKYYATYPEKYKKIVEGMAETSGLGLEKTIFLQSQETYVFSGLIAIAKGENISGSAQCSGLATWKDYTTDGQMIFGRNYDLGPVNHEYATLVVYNPIDGSVPTASFTFAGDIYVTSGMNRDGVFLELNNGSMSDKADHSGSRVFAPVALFNLLEQSKDIDTLSLLFNSTLPDLAYIINAADKNASYSFEWATTGVKRRNPDKDGLLAATNMFFDPAWGKQSYDMKKDSDAVVKRRDNLLSLAEAAKGQIDPAKMMDIMATPLENGGSFRAPNLTSYQIVAKPSELKLWLRVPEYQDWTEVDLAEYFNK